MINEVFFGNDVDGSIANAQATCSRSSTARPKKYWLLQKPRLDAAPGRSRLGDAPMARPVMRATAKQSRLSRSWDPSLDRFALLA